MTHTASQFASAPPIDQIHFPQEEEPGLEAQLRAALDMPGIAPDLARTGKRLLERLQRPVQVVVIGPAGCGKSTVVDMLLGTRVVGDMEGLALVELAFGDAAEVIFEDAAGEGVSVPGHLSDYEVPPGTVSGRQMLPHPMLRSLNLTEITVSGDLAHQQAILRHAAEYGDVILWCSQEFGEAEQALWAMVPERKRDSGFLVLTLADQHIMRGTLKDCVARLAPFVEDSFLGLYPVAARQGLQAKVGGADGDAQLWRASGGKRLAEDLRRRVAQGRAATQDQAEAVLWQLSIPVPDGPLPQPDQPPVAQQGGQAQQDQAAPAPTRSAKAKVAADPTTAVLGRALAQLQGKAEAMLTAAGDTPQSAEVLNQCLLAVQEMAETLLTAPGDSPSLQAARDASQDGSEMLMLLQLEQDEDAAVDAVTLLLQLKKELATPPISAQQEGSA